MKKVLFTTSILILLSFNFFAQSLLDVIPAPNYSYGLEHDGTDLWVGSSNGFNIWRIDDSTGAVLSSITSYTDETRGLAWDGSNLWGYQYRFGSSSGRKDKIIKYAADGTPLDSLSSPYEDYIGGMTYAMGYLYISVYYTGSGNPAYIIKIDPVTNNFVDTLIAPGLQPQGLAFDGHSLWCAMDDNDGDPERIWELDIATGDTIRSFPIPPYGSSSTARPKDLAWDGQYLYLVVGNSTDKVIYKFDVGGGGTPEINPSSSVLNFPSTDVGGSSDLLLNLVNVGNAPLIVDSVKSGSNYFSSDFSLPDTAAPGFAVPVTVSFFPDDFGFYTGTLSVYSNDPVNPVTEINLNGWGLYGGSYIWVSDTLGDFGNVWVSLEGTAYWKFNIENRGQDVLNVSGIENSLSEFELVNVSYPFSIESNDSAEITVRFTPSAQSTYNDTLKINSNSINGAIPEIILTGTGIIEDYSLGYQFWDFQVPTNPMTSFQDYDVLAVEQINDITRDGVNEIIAATDNYWLLCLDGASSGTSDTLWSFNIYKSSNNAGDIGGTNDFGVQDALDIASDLNSDGMNDVVIGTGGGNNHVYALDGTNGAVIWQFGNEVDWDHGDFEAVDVSRDYNNDGVPDVLAIADGNETGTTYKKAYLFNGVNGVVIWSYQYPGPNLSFGKTIISIDDVNGDSKPDAAIAVGNNTGANLKVYALDGQTGVPIWNFDVADYEPKELLELTIPAETPDIIAAKYFSTLYRLDGETGTQVWTREVGIVDGIIQIVIIPDLNNDNINDILVASFASSFYCISGADGSTIWSRPMAFQYGAAAVPDLNNDGLYEAITGDQNGNFYCLNGADGQPLFTHNFSGDRVMSVNILNSVDGNLSTELIAGTRNGTVACFSGGTQVVPVELTSFTASLAGTEVILKWKTGTETNNRGFEIERKINSENHGSEWQLIGFIEGHGSSTNKNNYSYIDDLTNINTDKIQYRLKQIDLSGQYEYSEIIEVRNVIPVSFSLSQNYPNPFNPATTIKYSVTKSEFVTLKVYDILGNEVAVLVNEQQSAGSYSITVDASELSSGVYFYRIQSGSFTDSKKMILLK